MPNLSDTALCFDRNAPATTLHVVRAADYARWAEEQPPAIKQWLGSTQHRGDAGTIAWLPDHAAPSVLAVIGPDPLYALGDLSYRLPHGTYRARGLTAPSAELLALGWGLGAYRYTRYKAVDRPPARLVAPDGCDDSLLRDQL